MNTKPKTSTQIIVALALVLLIVLSRMAPHPPNFTAVGAVAIFSGAFFRNRWASFVPFAGMIISDLFLPHYAIMHRLIVYVAFGLTFGIGYLIRKHYKLSTSVGAALASSTIFFLVTNCVFLYTAGWGPVMYPHTIQGQVLSYTYALPFFKWSLLGDLAYSVAFFAAYRTLTSASLRLQFIKLTQQRRALYARIKQN